MVTVSGFYTHAGLKQVYGGKIKYIGYPGGSGGSSFMSYLVLAIPSGGLNKDAAWEFISFVLSGKAQRSLLEKNALLTAFPVNKAVFDEYARSAAEKSVTEDSDGNISELPKASVFAGGELVSVYALPQEEIDEVLRLISSINSVSKIDYSVFEVIDEEAQIYFAGRRSAAEAAGIIQERITLYVNERR